MFLGIIVVVLLWSWLFFQTDWSCQRAVLCKCCTAPAAGAAVDKKDDDKKNPKEPNNDSEMHTNSREIGSDFAPVVPHTPSTS